MTTKKGDENLKGSASPHRSLYSISPHEKITKQTYNKLITDLNRSIKNQEVIELKFKTKINQEHQRERQKQTERLKRRKVNAEFLEKQIEEKNEKIKTGRIEAKRPGIPDDFNGYPNIFVTPLKEKRKQDRLRQAEFKKDLDKQLAYQNMLVLKKEREELDLENKIIKNANSEYRLQKLIYDEKKRKHRELLLESWSKAQYSKELRRKLDFITISGTKLPKVYNRSQISLLSRRESEVGLFESPLRLKKVLRNSASLPDISPWINRLDKSSSETNLEDKDIQKYSEKMKSMVQNTKNLRNFNNPSYKFTSNHSRLLKVLKKPFIRSQSIISLN